MKARVVAVKRSYEDRPLWGATTRRPLESTPVAFLAGEYQDGYVEFPQRQWSKAIHRTR
jgi:hypothetical protein